MNAAPLLAAALDYCTRGVSVVPLHTPTGDRCSCTKGAACLSPGKHTRIEWKPFQERRASPDEIRAWWARWPDSNVGIITGMISQLCVGDIDGRNGGFETLAELDARGLMMPANNPLVETGGLGLHHYLRLTTPLKKAAPFDGIELQADGALVVAPPSLHRSGRRYTWLRSLDWPMPPVPDWIVWAVRTMQAPEPSEPARPLLDADQDDVISALHRMGLYLGRHRRRGWHRIRCPWFSEHSNDDPEAVVIEPGAATAAAGWAWKCLHSHCSERHIGELLDSIGIPRRRSA